MKILFFALVFIGLTSFFFYDIAMEKYFPEKYWDENKLSEQLDYLLVKTDICFSSKNFADFVNWMTDDEYNQYLEKVRKIDPESFPFDSARHDYYEKYTKKKERLLKAKIRFENGFRVFQKINSEKSKDFLHEKINELQKVSKEEYRIKYLISEMINKEQEDFDLILFSFTSHETSIPSYVAEYLSKFDSK